jgi:CTP synthase (UTP-ammonia lyase)
MTGKRCVALVGDYNPAVIAHQAIPEALRLAGLQTGDDVEGVWLHTASIVDPAAQLRDFAGIWCVPASPYANPEGAVEAIRYAREQGRTFLGTCAGLPRDLAAVLFAGGEERRNPTEGRHAALPGPWKGANHRRLPL